jgi:hypothetical protein
MLLLCCMELEEELELCVMLAASSLLRTHRNRA